MRLRAIKINGCSGEFVTIGYVNDIYANDDKQGALGLEFNMPYILSCCDAAKLAKEMQECISVLEDFLGTA